MCQDRFIFVSLITKELKTKRTYKMENQGTFKNGDIVFIKNRGNKKVLCEFSHLTPKNEAYLHEIVTGSEKRKAFRRTLDKVWAASESDLNGQNNVDFSKDRSIANGAAITAINKSNEEQKKLQEEKQDIEKKKASFSINKRFQILRSLAHLTATGKRKALIITGEGGLGKTYEVMDVMKELNFKQELILEIEQDNKEDNGGAATDNLRSIGEFLKEHEEKQSNAVEVVEDEEGDFIVIKGFSTAKGLYNTLYEHREKLILFDDCDEVLENKIAKNILKAALDSYDRRFISWVSAGSSGNAPKQYEFTGQIIFISNLDKSKMDKAVLTRCSKVDVSMTPSEKIERMTTIINSPKYMPEIDFSIKQECVNLINENKHLGSISMRTLEESIIYRTEQPEIWEDLAVYSMVS